MNFYSCLHLDLNSNHLFSSIYIYIYIYIYIGRDTERRMFFVNHNGCFMKCAFGVGTENLALFQEQMSKKTLKRAKTGNEFFT